MSIQAPWNLKGYGYILIYKFKKEWIMESPHIDDEVKQNFKGGFGSIMLVNYKSSNVGPYKELLFIPSSFSIKNKKKKRISKIYVSTQESVENGKRNWAIPKEFANFKFIKTDRNSENIIVSKNNIDFFNINLQSSSLMFPVNTNLMPFPLAQRYNDKIYFTKFNGKGWGRFTKIKNISVNSDYFPSFASKPLIAIKIQPFNINFPKPIIEDA